MPELSKIIIVLAGALVGSWSLFLYIAKRWINSTDENVKDLYNRTNSMCNEIVKINTRCEERNHKSE